MNLSIEFNAEIIYPSENSSPHHQLLLNTTYSSSTTASLESQLGPKFKPLLFILFMSIVYTILFVCGLLGNLCSCLVICLNDCMRTTVNYYLFSLAISDVLSLLVGLLPELYSIIFGAYPWPFGQLFCILKTFAFETTTIASVLIILAFTFERWLRICRPFLAKTISSSLKRVLKIIAFIWLLSLCLATPFAFLTSTEFYIQNEPQSELCKPIDKFSDYMYNLLLLSSIFLFLVPMGLIIAMYIMIGLTLWRSQSSTHNHTLYSEESTLTKTIDRNQLSLDKIIFKIPAATSSVSLSYFLQRKTRQSRRDVVRMLFVIVICFFLCWAPHHLQRIMSFYLYRKNMMPYFKVSQWIQYIYEFLHYSSGILIYISPSINPICYNFMSKRYRTTLRKTLKMLAKCSCKSNTLEKTRQTQLLAFSNAASRGARKNYSFYSGIGGTQGDLNRNL